MKKLLAVLLAVVMLCLPGCGVVGDIAGSVANAAVKELETQVKQAMQNYQVDVVEVKTAMGNLNTNDPSAKQLFCVVLVKVNSESGLNACVSARDAIFEEAGSMVQTGSKVEHKYLVHKQLEYKFSDFSGDQTYYTVYAYSSDISLKLPDLSGMIPTGATAP